MGAVGLVIGIGLPLIGIGDSLGLVLYSIGAVVTVVRSQYYSHLRYPAPFLLLAIASFVLRLATRW